MGTATKFLNEFGDVYSNDRGLLFTIEYDPDLDEFHAEGVSAYDPETVFFVLAFEDRYFGWDVDLGDVFTFNLPPLAGILTGSGGSVCCAARTAAIASSSS